MVLDRRAGARLTRPIVTPKPRPVVKTWRLPHHLRLAEQARKRRVQVLKPAPSDPGAIARGIFRMSPKDERDLDRLIFDEGKREYGRTVAAEAQTLGYDIGDVRVTDRAVLNELRDRARESAHSIRLTYNKDLDAEIARIREDIPTANRNTYASQLRSWDAARAEWKNRQVAITEMGWTTNKGRLDFYENNEVEATVRVVPTDAVCDTCAYFVDLGEMSISEARVIPFPLHVNCPHTLEIVSSSKVPPSQDELWTGGV